MALFICPDEHENSLLSFVKKYERPRHSVMSRKAVQQRIEGFLPIIILNSTIQK